jgi:flagellar motor protein MotB
MIPGHRRRDEAEKPFWISFSDLMTALMVLFLLVMAVSLLTVTRQLRDVQRAETERGEEIAEIMRRLSDRARDLPLVHISTERLTIDFGEVGRFATGSDVLLPAAEDLLRGFVPRVLAEARSDLGRKWFKRVVVEGFTDSDGTYLYNLDLSLRRAERVVCTLSTPAPAGRPALSAGEMAEVRRLFLVGGFSFNSARGSKEESRRVELRLDFRSLDEKADGAVPGSDLSLAEAGKCLLR